MNNDFELKAMMEKIDNNEIVYKKKKDKHKILIDDKILIDNKKEKMNQEYDKKQNENNELDNKKANYNNNKDFNNEFEGITNLINANPSPNKTPLINQENDYGKGMESPIPIPKMFNNFELGHDPLDVINKNENVKNEGGQEEEQTNKLADNFFKEKKKKKNLFSEIDKYSELNNNDKKVNKYSSGLFKKK